MFLDSETNARITSLKSLEFPRIVSVFEFKTCLKDLSYVLGHKGSEFKFWRFHIIRNDVFNRIPCLVCVHGVLNESWGSSSWFSKLCNYWCNRFLVHIKLLPVFTPLAPRPRRSIYLDHRIHGIMGAKLHKSLCSRKPLCVRRVLLILAFAFVEASPY